MSQPAKHKIVISTRPAGQNTELAMLLENEGYLLLEMPLIEIVPSVLSKNDIDTIKAINQFDWIVFTSPNGIRIFFDHYQSITGNTHLPTSLNTAVVGKTTQKILAEYGSNATLVNQGNTGKELAEAMLTVIQSNQNILFPEGDLARGQIIEILSAKAQCTRLVVYENRMPENIDQKLIQQIIDDRYDFIILTSPSGFLNLKKVFENKIDMQKLRLISIGTTTTAEIENHGLRPYGTALMSNAQGIAKSIVIGQ